MYWRGLSVVLAAIFLLQTGWWLGQFLPSNAWAQETPRDVSPATVVSSVKCRVFAVDINNGDPLETNDRTSVVGQWVGEQLDASFKFHSIDFEVGQKSTGYQQGWAQICMSA